MLNLAQLTQLAALLWEI